MSFRAEPETSRRLLFLGCIVAALALAMGSGCPGNTVNILADLDEARRLAADLRVQFNKAADAANRAVMADTDEASTAFAHDAEQTKALVDSDVAALAPLLQRLSFANELRILDQFRNHFSAYQNLDRRILELAIENTNLKAQRLSFGPARQAADGMRDTLGTIAASIAAKDRCRVEALVAQALLAVREVQVLYAPHIAEADDAAMTAMEKQITESEATARDALNTLGGIVEPNARPSVVSALAALDQFKSVSDQILKLSRRNSNVRSLELSLGTKPGLTAACDESLRALVEALAKEGSKATR